MFENIKDYLQILKYLEKITCIIWELANFKVNVFHKRVGHPSEWDTKNTNTRYFTFYLNISTISSPTFESRR
jgi:hypothetical protein